MMRKRMKSFTDLDWCTKGHFEHSGEAMTPHPRIKYGAGSNPLLREERGFK